MAIILNGQDLGQQSELQKRVTAELREKQSGKQLVGGDVTTPTYDSDDSEYTKDLKPTTSLAWLWALIGVVIAGIIVAIMVITS